jgi:uncharacterized protein YciI
MAQFLYQFFPIRPEFVTAPDSRTPHELQTFEAHVAYLQLGAANNIVMLAGRCQDNIGPAIVIIDLPDEATAQNFMENDPFVKGGIARATLHPFRAAFMRTAL